ncbi:hypothetical protein SAMN05660652_01509 [Propionivibrio dicarboxylicus]|uniref:Uncharacterized protein n=1 Tax=Propionivibrio dicarboxylicus TaxID=83767 RepID=A0A1G8BGW5_9RHOO|nr:hypothetical protein SAMN05660652_01509 [Propionivibrio dicarboxylicus]
MGLSRRDRPFATGTGDTGIYGRRRGETNPTRSGRRRHRPSLRPCPSHQRRLGRRTTREILDRLPRKRQSVLARAEIETFCAFQHLDPQAGTESSGDEAESMTLPCRIRRFRSRRRQDIGRFSRAPQGSRRVTPGPAFIDRQIAAGTRGSHTRLCCAGSVAHRLSFLQSPCHGGLAPRRRANGRTAVTPRL